MQWSFVVAVVMCMTVFGCDRKPEWQSIDRDGARARTALSASLPDKEPRFERCVVRSKESPPSVPRAVSCPPDPVVGGAALDTAVVSFPSGFGSPSLRVELARTPLEQERGLMYRTAMPDDAGMLFDFPGRPEVHSFWMKNTCLPLDMLFIADDGFITGILENVPTLNTLSRSIPCPVRYVLEVNAGWTRRNGVFAGQFATMP